MPAQSMRVTRCRKWSAAASTTPAIAGSSSGQLKSYGPGQLDGRVGPHPALRCCPAGPILDQNRTSLQLIPASAAVLDRVEPTNLECHFGVQPGGKGQKVARRPKADRRQADFFDAPAPMPAAPEHRPAPKPKQGIKHQSPPSDSDEASLGNSIDVLAARLSRTEWNELVATLPDDALAHLVIATARQLRRRLARSRGQSGKGRASALERSAQQLIVELGGQGEDDDWYEG